MPLPYEGGIRSVNWENHPHLSPKKSAEFERKLQALNKLQQHQSLSGSQVPQHRRCCRSVVFSTFPVAFRGRAGIRITRLGTL